MVADVQELPRAQKAGAAGHSPATALRPSLRSVALAVCALAILALARPARAAEPEPGPILTDRNTGLALWGYDPIAFFLDGRAEPGEPRYELPYGGATWRFANAGNLAAFEESPRIYMPTFGGYDPNFAARRAAVPGNPEIFAIWNNRLFLFRDAASRERFLTDPPSAFRAAEAGWPESAATLPR